MSDVRQFDPTLVHTCDSCMRLIRTSRYHCIEGCVDFDLCQPCFEREGHPHATERVPLRFAVTYPEVEPSRTEIIPGTQTVDNERNQNRSEQSETRDLPEVVTEVEVATDIATRIIQRNPQAQLIPTVDIPRSHLGYITSGQTVLQETGGWIFVPSPTDDFLRTRSREQLQDYINQNSTLQPVNPRTIIQVPCQRMRLSHRAFSECVLHARNCDNETNCANPHCSGMKQILHHLMICPTRGAGGCCACENFIRSVHGTHARFCLNNYCPLSQCLATKHRLGLNNTGLNIPTPTSRSGPSASTSGTSNPTLSRSQELSELIADANADLETASLSTRALRQRSNNFEGSERPSTSFNAAVARVDELSSIYEDAVDAVDRAASAIVSVFGLLDQVSGGPGVVPTSANAYAQEPEIPPLSSIASERRDTVLSLPGRSELSATETPTTSSVRIAEASVPEITPSLQLEDVVIFVPPAQPLRHSGRGRRLFLRDARGMFPFPVQRPPEMGANPDEETTDRIHITIAENIGEENSRNPDQMISQNRTDAEILSDFPLVPLAHQIKLLEPPSPSPSAPSTQEPLRTTRDILARQEMALLDRLKSIIRAPRTIENETLVYQIIRQSPRVMRSYMLGARTTQSIVDSRGRNLRRRRDTNTHHPRTLNSLLHDSDEDELLEPGGNKRKKFINEAALPPEGEVLEDPEKSHCPICLENPRNVAFFCGHLVCYTCSENLLICHLCRKPILGRIKLFL